VPKNEGIASSMTLARVAAASSTGVIASRLVVERRTVWERERELARGAVEEGRDAVGCRRRRSPVNSPGSSPVGVSGGLAKE
jgi:hypothetical protein